jgi:hypothetical protein
MLPLPLVLVAAAAAAAASSSSGQVALPHAPALTPFQRHFLSTNRATAAAADARARPTLLSALESPSLRAHLRSVHGLDPALLDLPAEQLLVRLERELAANEVMHTFPASVATLLARKECSNCADTDLKAEQTATFLRNLWVLPLDGDRCTPPPVNTSFGGTPPEACGTEDWLWGCDLAEGDAFCAQSNFTHCFPAFTSQRAGVNHQVKPLAWPASMDEATQRPVYHSSNFHRSPGPVHQFGQVTFIMNRSIVDPLTFIFPVDSGDFEGDCGGKNAFEKGGDRFVNCSAYSGEMGAPGLLSHSVLAWAGYLNLTAGQDAIPFNLANLIAGLTLPFRISGRPVGSFVPSALQRYDQEDWYWEANTVGPLQYPEAVSMVIASYAELFGSEQGAELRRLCLKWRWPLAWALGQPPSSPDVDNDKWVAANINATVARILDPIVLSGHSNMTAASQVAKPTYELAWERAAALNLNATGWSSAAADWEAFATADSLAALSIEPLQSGKCEGQRNGLCMGVLSNGHCVCTPT